MAGKMRFPGGATFEAIAATYRRAVQLEDESLISVARMALDFYAGPYIAVAPAIGANQYEYRPRRIRSEMRKLAHRVALSKQQQEEWNG